MSIIGISASGSTAYDATPLRAEGQVSSFDVQTVPVGSGVRMPHFIYSDTVIIIRDSDVNNLLIYPIPPDGTIDRLPDPVELAPDDVVTLWSMSSIDWVTLAPGNAPPPYNAPAFTSFGIQGQATIVEVGTTVGGGAVTFTWSTSNSGNVKPNSISILDITGSAILASGLANSGSDTITISSITENSPATYTWQIDGVNTKNANMSPDNFAITWLWRVYAGTNAASTLTANQIKALADFDSLASGFTGTYNYADPVTAKYYYFCFPASMGTATNFIDANTGFPVDITELSPVSVTNAQGVATSYTVWRTTNNFAGAFSMRVS